MIRRHIATSLTVLLALGIGYVGASYVIAPAATAPGFGMAAWPEGDAALFLVTKGLRDIVSGIIPLVLLVAGRRRALGLVLLAIALVPLGDAALIISTGGALMMAFAVHGATAAAVIVTAVLLLTERPVAVDAT